MYDMISFFSSVGWSRYGSAASGTAMARSHVKHTAVLPSR